MRVAAAILILIPAAILLRRWHDRAVRTRRVVELKGLLERSWLEPLRRNQGAIAMSEYDGITALDHQPGISDVVYFNKFAEVRWSEDSWQTTKALRDFSLRYPLPNAVIDAHAVGLPFIQSLPGEKSHAIALPLTERGFVQGLVFFKATDAAMADLVARGTDLFPASLPRPIRTRFPGDSKIQQASQAYLSGVIYLQRGEISRARAKWREAVSFDPDNADAQEGLQRLPRSNK